MYKKVYNVIFIIIVQVLQAFPVELICCTGGNKS